MRRRFERLRRESDDVVTGVAVRYGDIALNENGMPERFAAGSVHLQDPVLNLQHNREIMLARQGAGLSFEDGPRELRVRAKIPPTEYGRRALELIEHKIVRGFSVEYHPFEGGERLVDGVYVIERAAVTGLALVDKPAYRQSVIERALVMPLRRRQGGLSAFVEFGEVYTTTAANRRKRVIVPGALDLAPEGVLLLHGDYSKPLASQAEGSLQVDLTEKSVALWAPHSRLRRSPYWSDANKLIRAGLITGVVPGIQVREVETYEDSDGFTVERILEGSLCEGYLRSREGAAPVRAGRRRRWRSA